MDRFFGFDLGDAESAVARLRKGEQAQPEMLKVGGAESFVSAFARLPDGRVQIGEAACYQAEAVHRGLRFKSRFLTDSSSHADIRSFASGVLGELTEQGDLHREEDTCFYVGCPAGWDKNDRERYREIFEKAGYPPLRIISESRAAMVSACQSRHLQVGYDILSRPVLVVDIGSSTTDFAYIMGGKEVEMQTAGEVKLGGGIMDEILLEQCVAASVKAPEIEAIFRECDPWRTFCEFAARRLKERYFSDEDYWKENDCRETVLIRYNTAIRLPLVMNPEMAEKLLEGPSERLSGKSFRQVFTESLEAVRDHISGSQPELLFLTGGVSRLPAVREWCREVFPETVVVAGAEPEFSVARGLAWCGKIDEELREFRKELEEMNASKVVEELVRKHIKDLYRSAVDALVDPIIDEVAAPVFERWRNGEIRRLSDTDEEMQKGIADWLRSEEAKEILTGIISSWLKPVADALEEYTVPICVKHHIPYKALSLSSYLEVSDIDIRLEARNLFAVEEFTWLIDSIISVIVGIMCGTGEVTLLSGGPVGILAGALLSLFLLILGKKPMEKVFLKTDIPAPVRKLVPKNTIRNRKTSLAATVKENFYESLAQDKNEEISSRMVEEISVQIERCLTHMAEVVEIPLG